MVEEWVIKKFNRGFNQQFLITESDGVTQKDISGYTVVVKAWEKGATTTIISGTCVRTATVLSAGVNCVHYTIASGVIQAPGKYLFELELISSGQVELRDTRTYSLRVEDSAPGDD